MLRNQGVSAPVSAVIIYKCSDYTLINLFIIYLLIIYLYSYKHDYLINNPQDINSDTSMEDIDEDDIDIYINSQEDSIKDELIAYFKEKRVNKKVSKRYLIHLKIS